MEQGLLNGRIADVSPPASQEELNMAQELLGCVIPDCYKELLQLTNGGNTEYVCFYGTQDLPERNETFEVAEYAPGHVAIGCDGGGCQLLMEAKADAQSVRLVDGGVMAPADTDPVLPSLWDWLFGGEGDPGDPLAAGGRAE